MKRLLPILCLLLLSVPGFAAGPVIVSASTTTPVTFVMRDATTGAIVTSPTITGVSYRKGTATAVTAMDTPTTGVVPTGGGECYLIADEGTTITGGLVRENIEYIITASDAETAHVRCVIEAAQVTLTDIGDEVASREMTLTAGTITDIVTAVDTWWKAVSYFVQSPIGDTQYTNHATDPTAGSNPTSYTDAPAGGTATTP